MSIYLVVLYENIAIFMSVLQRFDNPFFSNIPNCECSSRSNSVLYIYDIFYNKRKRPHRVDVLPQDIEGARFGFRLFLQ